MQKIAKYNVVGQKVSLDKGTTSEFYAHTYGIYNAVFSFDSFWDGIDLRYAVFNGKIDGKVPLVKIVDESDENFGCYVCDISGDVLMVGKLKVGCVGYSSNDNTIRVPTNADSSLEILEIIHIPETELNYTITDAEIFKNSVMTEINRLTNLVNDIDTYALRE